MRGGTRGSCNSCREKKRKCDLLSRLEEGIEICSRCARQKAECYIGSPDESCTYKRQRLEHSTSSSSLRDKRLTPSETIPPSTLPQLPINGGSTNLESQELSAAFTECCDSLSPETTTNTFQEEQDLSSQFSTSPSGLSSKTSSFLRRLFLGDSQPQSSEMTPVSATCSVSSTFGLPTAGATGTAGNPRSTLVISAPPHLNTRSVAFQAVCNYVLRAMMDGSTSPQKAVYQTFVIKCGLGISGFVESLHGYFDFPALCRPCIPEDAFWQDFHADRCGEVLLLAIACHGIPFTNVIDKEKKQQRLAAMFQEALMKTVTAEARTCPVRLDDLEGMALMSVFKYGNARKPADRSRDLFMTHDALILRVLQARDRGPRDMDPSALFARADERFTLLYWDVFSLDAFQCLSHKSMSLLPDNALAWADDFPRYEAGSYLEAVFNLSIIARRIVEKLCNATAKATGVAYEDITLLHEQLCHWRSSLVALDLQRPIDRGDEFSMEDLTSKESTPIPADRVVPLQRALLWALEINCLLQIDDCVAQYGLRNGNSIHAEVLSAKCLGVALEAVNLAESIKKHPPGDGHSKELPLVDLAPFILRNLCADLCRWICTRGRGPSEALHPQALDTHSFSHEESFQDLRTDIEAQRRADYAAIANTLRDAVAAASSHRDTKQMLGRLDDEIASLQEV